MHHKINVMACFLVGILLLASEQNPVDAETFPAANLSAARGPLAHLEYLQPGKTMRASSSDIWDWKNGNSDARPIEPGETLVIADLEGPGRIQHIWNTIASVEEGASRLVVIRMYWDGEETPSVEAPLGDFFVIGHGINRAMQSLPVMVSAEGRARNCYWPMPFRKSAKITITNEGEIPVKAFYHYVDWQKLPSLPEETPYFHALYRQEYPTSPDKNYLLADIEGRGHYVGTVLNVRQREGGWFGEGDDFFYIDGEKEPSLRGTGTEDYFCDAWGFREFNGPFYGVPVYDNYRPNGLITAYRWHVTDPISFQKSLRVEIEHKGAKFGEDGSVTSGYATRIEDFSSVSYWYQTGTQKPFPSFPTAKSRLYPGFQDTVEAEELFNRATVSGGGIERQEGVHWSNESQLFWRPLQANESIELPLNIKKKGIYNIKLSMTHAPDYGKFEVSIKGTPQTTQLDLYSETIENKKWSLLEVPLEEGEQLLVFQNVGKSEKSTGYFLGIDAVVASQVD